MSSQTTGALAPTTHAPLLFTFEQSAIRVVVRDGEPWFVAVDVCAALGLQWKGSGSTGTLASLDADEKASHGVGTQGGQQQAAIISESGMYCLVLRCRDAVKPGTGPHRFRKWVTAEVLPAIRKTGAYAPTTPKVDRYAAAAHMARSLLDLLRSFDMPEEKTHAIAIEHIRRETGVELASAFATITDQLALTPERRAVLEREALRIVKMIPEDSVGAAHQLLNEITKAQLGVTVVPAIA
jgi:prophage antirepressor-like protein